jgi:hypothetical protein
VDTLPDVSAAPGEPAINAARKRLYALPRRIRMVPWSESVSVGRSARASEMRRPPRCRAATRRSHADRSGGGRDRVHRRVGLGASMARAAASVFFAAAPPESPSRVGSMCCWPSAQLSRPMWQSGARGCQGRSHLSCDRYASVVNQSADTSSRLPGALAPAVWLLQRFCGGRAASADAWLVPAQPRRRLGGVHVYGGLAADRADGFAVSHGWNIGAPEMRITSEWQMSAAAWGARSAWLCDAR